MTIKEGANSQNSRRLGSVIATQLKRVGIGGVFGSMICIAFHLVTRDSHFTKQLQTTLDNFQSHFDGFRAYWPELLTFGFFTSILLLKPAWSAAVRHSRAWRAGVWSLTGFIAALGTFAALQYGSEFPTVIGLGVISLGIVATSESFREAPKSPTQSDQPVKLGIPPTNRNVPPELAWKASSSDDPIAQWHEDIIGRTAVVELLADHALRLHTPVVALQGGLGDGKSSVLNLLAKALEGRALVVPFSAWLPGSEATFATDLFGDIAKKCGRYISIPHLGRLAATYARTISGSVSRLSGLKELFPNLSQRQEIEELRYLLSRVPLPVVVTLDEIDRMQRDELLVLLKVLRGASSIPNVTFVCAFSEEELRKELERIGEKSRDYWEKFFPVSVTLSAPDSEMLGRCFQTRIKTYFAEEAWFSSDDKTKKFPELLGRFWKDSLSKVCTNFRKIGLLVNDVESAARPITGEVNPFDLIAVEALRRFYRETYRLVRTNPLYLTYPANSLVKGEFMSEERKKKGIATFVGNLNKSLDGYPEPSVGKAMLAFLFPDYTAGTDDRFWYSSIRPTNEELAEDQKRICDGDYFPIYFRGAVPEDMFSNAEMERVISELEKAKTLTAVEAIFCHVLDGIPKGHPKRDDFLWKLSRQVELASDLAAEGLAFAAANRADDYAYDRMNVGEAARALNIVFSAAQKVSASAAAQRILVGAMARTTDDTFALRLLDFTENRDRNKVLTNFSNINVAEVRREFMERMRKRYGLDTDIHAIDIHKGNWRAFHVWVHNSEED